MRKKMKPNTRQLVRIAARRSGAFNNQPGESSCVPFAATLATGLLTVATGGATLPLFAAVAVGTAAQMAGEAVNNREALEATPKPEVKATPKPTVEVEVKVINNKPQEPTEYDKRIAAEIKKKKRRFWWF